MVNLQRDVLVLAAALLSLPSLAHSWRYGSNVSNELVGGAWELRTRVTVGLPPVEGGDAMLTGGPIRCLPVAFCRNEPASPTCRQGACALRGARFQLVAGFSGGDTVPASRVLSGALTLADGTVCPVDPATRIYGKFIGPVARRVIVPYGASSSRSRVRRARSRSSAASPCTSTAPSCRLPATDRPARGQPAPGSVACPDPHAPRAAGR
jgi:hypothetical protein